MFDTYHASPPYPSARRCLYAVVESVRVSQCELGTVGCSQSQCERAYGAATPRSWRALGTRPQDFARMCARSPHGLAHIRFCSVFPFWSLYLYFFVLFIFSFCFFFVFSFFLFLHLKIFRNLDILNIELFFKI